MDYYRGVFTYHPAGYAVAHNIAKHGRCGVTAAGVAECAVVIKVGQDNAGPNGPHGVGQMVKEAGEQHIKINARPKVAGEMQQKFGLALLITQAALGALEAQHRPHAGQQFIDLHRLNQKVVGTCVQTSHARGEVGVGGEDHHRDEGLGQVSLNPTSHLVAIHPRQAKVEQDDVGGDQVKVGQSLLATAGKGDTVAAVAERIAVDATDEVVILDNQDVGWLDHGMAVRVLAKRYTTDYSALLCQK